MLLSKLLIQYDAQQASRPSFRSRTQFSTPPTHTWRKCRIAAPKTSPHHGVVRSSTGTPCTTTATLDQALRATRHFWQEPPLPYGPQWESLSSYSTQCDPLPPCPPPSHPSLYHAVSTSPDSAPGADGIPYSAWRIRITTDGDAFPPPSLIAASVGIVSLAVPAVAGGPPPKEGRVVS